MDTKLVYLLLKDFKHLRNFIFKEKIRKYLPKEVREDIENLRSMMIIRENNKKC